MPIIDGSIRPRLRELGRIRGGEKKQKPGGKPYPSRLGTWRLTSPSRDLLDQAAALWGGTVTAWEDEAHDGDQWQVTLATDTIPVVVPGETPDQWYELWAGGGCQRRCDGVTEHLGDQPCLCEPGPDRDCQTTTRFNVLLPDLPDLGQWRLETHSFYAAIELAGFIQFLQASNARFVRVNLRLDKRTVKRPGEPTKRFAVPVPEIAERLGDMLSRAGLSTPIDAPKLPAPQDTPTGEDPEPPLEDEPPGPVALSDDEAATDLVELLAVDVDETHTMPILEDRLRRLYRHMEQLGYWPRTTSGLDALHVALHKHHQADHVGDLRKKDLVALCRKSWDAARTKTTKEPTT